jgi:hypothetical protein
MDVAEIIYECGGLIQLTQNRIRCWAFVSTVVPRRVPQGISWQAEKKILTFQEGPYAVQSISSAFKSIIWYNWTEQGNGPIRHVETCPDFFLTARVHTTTSTIKILAANTHCRYFFKNCWTLPTCQTLGEMSTPSRARHIALWRHGCV